ncbi:hypothetical protein BABINDRAFT_13340 [Babjeviella inositovora NRRL Y-12698]|uniref:Uncharacterized protein n=1 Tax=Babjeviella inositovora NRRL Y-12698 TaxID=984486 RepID=A0A1E3QPV5_9ASCO|nr:uncharacterized protein BABINDRAFT_13340 [Babjeviella inositovora NRRL Y-12698]ODQ79715.1 hypothetical protein BABINDRAFT_13340 [Babjeviella inositovora NRRL Y-12698]
MSLKKQKSWFGSTKTQPGDIEILHASVPHLAECGDVLISQKSDISEPAPDSGDTKALVLGQRSRPQSKSLRFRDALSNVFSWNHGVTVAETLSPDSSTSSSDSEEITRNRIANNTKDLVSGTNSTFAQILSEYRLNEAQLWASPASRLGIFQNAEYGIFQAQSRMIKLKMDDYPLCYTWNVWNDREVTVEERPTTSTLRTNDPGSATLGRKFHSEMVLETNLDLEELIYSFKGTISRLDHQVHVFKSCLPPRAILQPIYGGALVFQIPAGSEHPFWRAVLRIVVGERMFGLRPFGIYGISWKNIQLGSYSNLSLRLISKQNIAVDTLKTWCDALRDELPDSCRDFVDSARFVDIESQNVYIVYP